MGGGSSKNQKQAAPTNHHNGDEVSHHWKMLPSIDEARGKFREDGTLAKSVDPGHLELRTLLEEPLGQHSIGTYAKKNHAHESFMCWVDLQEFKTIPDDAFQYRRSKALHIHQKYIKTGAVSEFGGLEPEERDQVERPASVTWKHLHLLLHRPCSSHSLTHYLQSACF